MSDATLNEEIARLEIEIDAVRDALDEAIKRNESLEEEAAMLRGQRDAAIADYNDALAALDKAREALAEIVEIVKRRVADPPSPGDRNKCVAWIASSALKSMEPAP